MKPDTILGYFQNYKITTQLRALKCSEWESDECVEHQKVQFLYEANITEETVYGLKKFRWYRFQVAASTNAGYGNASSWISTRTLPGREYCLDIFIHTASVMLMIVTVYKINKCKNELCKLTYAAKYLLLI